MTDQGYQEPHYIATNDGYYGQQPMQQTTTQNVGTPLVQQQQVVVTQTNNPLIPHSQGLLADTGYHNIQTPIFFYVLIGAGILEIISGIAQIASGNSELIGSYIGPAIAFFLIAFCIKNLEIRTHSDHIYIGFGPLQLCCADYCLQRHLLHYDNIQAYYKRENQCWYPQGYHPGMWERNGNDCFPNIFYRGCCCCTNTFFYNAACSACCTVFSSRELVVFELKQPIHCCCHTLNNIAVSVENNQELANYLNTHGINDGDAVFDQSNDFLKTKSPPPMQSQQQPIYQAPPQQEQPQMEGNVNQQTY